MARHPQSSPRGLFAKKKIMVPASGSLLFNDYSSSTGLLSGDSTGLKVAGSIKVAGKANAVIGGNSTGITVTAIKLNSTTRHLKANSTGILINGRYLSTNTTGNNTG